MRVRLNVSKLQDILARSELSQNHWAIKVGVSRGHWSDLVNGRHPYPSPKTRQRMIEVLGVPADELFTIESGPTAWHDTDFRAALQDRYLIERELGQGAMGAVYVALDVARNRRVAVKVLAPEAVCGIGQETFLREISTVSRLHHPHILPLFDSGVVAEHPFFVMPWVRGGSLRDRLKEERRIDIATAVEITRGVADGLTHTHRDFVLHCDVKPENILLHGTHAWLADFGISRIVHAEVSEWRARKGIDVSAGTPAYVSPEQALGEELDGRTDTYSLGCVQAHEPFVAVMARWLAIISAIILFISCANVANLLLARLARRQRELAVRVALGSGRARVVRLLALEGLLIAVGAAALASAVILAVEPVVKGALFPGGAWAFTLFDARILAVVAGFALLTGVLVAVAPAIQAGRRQFGEVLRAGARGGHARSPLRSGLTIMQAALSVVLLVGAGLFVRSVQRVNAVDLGMDPHRVLTVDVRYPPVQRHEGEAFAEWLARSDEIERATYRDLVTAVRRVPGVEHASVMAGGVPFSGSVSVGLWVPGRDSIATLPGGGPYVTAAGDDYFATIGTPIRSGRGFTAADHATSEAVVVVNETMARSLWPDRTAIGECVHIQSRTAPCARVVGVAADVHRSGLTEDPSMQFYVPIGQERGFSGSSLLVRPRGAPDPSWRALRDALQAADPRIRSIDARVLAQGLAGETRPFKLGLTAFGLSALLALIVAGLGLYSIMAHAVAWRRHEIGVRLALGASRNSIAALVVGRGTVLATIGIGIGVIVVFASRTWVEPVLFQTSATDPAVLLGVVVVLEAVALLAGWLPTRRAVAVPPTEALRGE